MTVCDGVRQLNRSQQVRRLAALARATLAQYGLGAARIEPLHYRSNAIFRVTRQRDGQRFVLRIHSPEIPEAYVRSELTWLDALAADGFTVPCAVAADAAGPIVTVALPQAPEARVCTLLTWIDGRRAWKRPTSEQVCRIGREIARLHRHASRFGTPLGFTRPLWDPDSLIGAGSWHAGWRRLTAGQFRLMRGVADRFRAAATGLGRGGEVFGLIHGDFTFDNVLFHRGEVRVMISTTAAPAIFCMTSRRCWTAWNGGRIIATFARR